jgi:hypothetical protein
MTTKERPIRITVEFDSVEDAVFAHMFLNRCGFHEFYDRTEPHLGKEIRTERAYRIGAAIGRIEKALCQAEVPTRIYGVP